MSEGDTTILNHGTSLTADMSGVSPQYVAGLLDGTNDGLGYGLVNPPIKSYISHNGCETKLYTSEVALVSTKHFYSADLSTPDLKSWKDFKEYVSGNENLWIGMATPTNKSCCVTRVAAYEDAKLFTLIEYSKIVSRLPNICGAGQIVPEYDLDGSVEINLDGSIEYVQPND